MKRLVRINAGNGFLFICLILIIFLIGFYVGFYHNSYTSSNETSGEKFNAYTDEDSIIKQCSNLKLIDTANCLVNSIKPFYKYNETDDSLNLSFEEIQKYGEDCRGWALMYERLIKKLDGYFGTSVHITIIKGELAHRIVIISNEEGYCIIDQLKVNCFLI